jgi:hypothetical protein
MSDNDLFLSRFLDVWNNASDCEGHLASILVFLFKKSYNCEIRYKNLSSRVVRYAVKGPKTSIWASCNVLHQKLRSAAKVALILCSMQHCYQMYAIFSMWHERAVPSSASASAWHRTRTALLCDGGGDFRRERRLSEGKWTLCTPRAGGQKGIKVRVCRGCGGSGESRKFHHKKLRHGGDSVTGDDASFVN